MPDTVFNKKVPTGQTTVTVQCSHDKQNIRWVVWQLSVESNPIRSSAVVSSVRRNGRYLTSSILVPSAAQGPPSIMLEASNVLEVKFDNMVAGDDAIVTLWYEEVQSGQYGSQFGLV